MEDKFKTILTPSMVDFREKASKFIAYAFPVETEEEAQKVVEILWKEHIKATHICYAYKLGLDDNKYRINDDGEPSGTAGKPIYGQILSNHLTDIIICVVRYYGGTKLGVSGLIAAYKEAAGEAINQSAIVEKTLCNGYLCATDYEHMGQVMNVLKELDIKIIDKKFETDVELKIALTLSESSSMLKRIKANLLNFELNRIDDETSVSFCSFNKIEIIKL